MLPLTGDASDRRYYRAILHDGDSMVLALHAGSIEFDRMPFVSVARLLAAIAVAGAAHPASLGRARHHRPAGPRRRHACRHILVRRPPDEHDALYRQAVSFIARLQTRGAELASEDYPPYRVAFDTDKLAWEFEFFYKYFLKAYRGVSPSVDGARGRSRRSGPQSSKSSRTSRVCCAIATITVAI